MNNKKRWVNVIIDIVVTFIFITILMALSKFIILSFNLKWDNITWILGWISATIFRIFSVSLEVK